MLAVLVGLAGYWSWAASPARVIDHMPLPPGSITLAQRGESPLVIVVGATPYVDRFVAVPARTPEEFCSEFSVLSAGFGQVTNDGIPVSDIYSCCWGWPVDGRFVQLHVPVDGTARLDGREIRADAGMVVVVISAS